MEGQIIFIMAAQQWKVKEDNIMEGNGTEWGLTYEGISQVNKK